MACTWVITYPMYSLLYRVSQKKKKKNAIIGWGLYFKNLREILKKLCPFLSRSWIYLYNGEIMG